MSNALAEKMKCYDTRTIRKMVLELVKQNDEDSGLVLEYALNELENRMPENDFINFCDELYANS